MTETTSSLSKIMKEQYANGKGRIIGRMLKNVTARRSKSGVVKQGPSAGRRPA